MEDITGQFKSEAVPGKLHIVFTVPCCRPVRIGSHEFPGFTGDDVSEQIRRLQKGTFSAGHYPFDEAAKRWEDLRPSGSTVYSIFDDQGELLGQKTEAEDTWSRQQAQAV